MQTTKIFENIFKQLKLSNSLFKDNFILTKNIYPSDVVIRHAKSESANKLSRFILEQQDMPIIKSETDYDVHFQTELLVLKMSDFKAIVEAAIQMMPQEAIDKIRG